MTIHKYPFPISQNGELIIQLPVGAKILTVQFQRQDLCLWAMVDPAAASESVTLRMFGTGHDVTLPPNSEYLGTVQQYGGTFVWHIFKEGK